MFHNLCHMTDEEGNAKNRVCPECDTTFKVGLYQRLTKGPNISKGTIKKLRRKKSRGSAELAMSFLNSPCNLSFVSWKLCTSRRRHICIIFYKVLCTRVGGSDCILKVKSLLLFKLLLLNSIRMGMLKCFSYYWNTIQYFFLFSISVALLYLIIEYTISCDLHGLFRWIVQLILAWITSNLYTGVGWFLCIFCFPNLISDTCFAKSVEARIDSVNWIKKNQDQKNGRKQKGLEFEMCQYLCGDSFGSLIYHRYKVVRFHMIG